MQDNAGDRKAVRKAEKAAKQQQVADDAVLASLMSTVQGRAWIWRRLERCKVFVNAFDLNDRIEAFTLGEANVGRELLADIIRVCPDDYIQAMREANERAGSTVHRNDDDGSTAAESAGGEDDGRDDQGSDEDRDEA
jgi:hypothetical protein